MIVGAARCPPGAGPERRGSRSRDWGRPLNTALPRRVFRRRRPARAVSATSTATRSVGYPVEVLDNCSLSFRLEGYPSRSPPHELPGPSSTARSHDLSSIARRLHGPRRLSLRRSTSRGSSSCSMSTRRCPFGARYRSGRASADVAGRLRPANAGWDAQRTRTSLTEDIGRFAAHHRRPRRSGSLRDAVSGGTADVPVQFSSTPSRRRTGRSSSRS